jgi:hypothetical protein
MQTRKLGHPFTCHGGLRQQDHDSMNVRILNNSHARQKQNEKNALNRVKKKTKLEWDGLQAQAQQMP